MIGMEAVNQLLVALEVHRFDFCFIGAGYERGKKYPMKKVVGSMTPSFSAMS